MSAIAVPIPHVPIARAVAPAKERQPSLDRALAARPARAVFRAIPWSGAAPPTPPPREPSPPPDAWASVTRVLAAIPWTGERPEAPTHHQADHCVRAMLDAFRWE